MTKHSLRMAIYITCGTHWATLRGAVVSIQFTLWSSEMYTTFTSQPCWRGENFLTVTKNKTKFRRLSDEKSLPPILSCKTSFPVLWISTFKGTATKCKKAAILYNWSLWVLIIIIFINLVISIIIRQWYLHQLQCLVSYAYFVIFSLLYSLWPLVWPAFECHKLETYMQ